jgi:hypothetical protein
VNYFGETRGGNAKMKPRWYGSGLGARGAREREMRDGRRLNMKSPINCDRPTVNHSPCLQASMYPKRLSAPLIASASSIWLGNASGIVHGVDFLSGKGCTRMRPSCSCSFLGTTLRVHWVTSHILSFEWFCRCVVSNI